MTRHTTALLPLLSGCIFIGAGERVIEHQSFTVDATFDAVDIEVDSGSIFVRGSDSPGEVDLELHYGRKEPVVDWWVKGGTLYIDADCPTGAWMCVADVEVTVPWDAKADLLTGSGSAEVRNLSGPVAVETGSGSVELAGLAGVVDAGTGSGSIYGSGLTCPVLTGETGSGSIDLVFASTFDLVDVSTGSGSIDLLVPDDAYHCVTSTGSGAVDIHGITLDDDSDHVILASTGSGSVQITGYSVGLDLDAAD